MPDAEHLLSLPASELFFSLSVDMMCVIDAEGRFVEVNSAWSEVLGYPVEDFIGVPYRAFVHPDDLAGTSHADEASRHTGVDRFVNRYRHRDGHYLNLQWRAIGRDGNIYAIARDITDQLEEAQRLQQSEEAHRLLFEVSRQGVMYHDERGAIVAMNAAARHILGVVGPLGEGHPWDCFDAAGALLPDTEHPPYLALRTGQPVLDRLLGVGQGAPERWIRMDSVPIFEESTEHPARVYTTFLDVTAEQQAEAQAREALADLEFRSSHDVLTGLPNRAMLIDFLDAALRHAEYPHGRVALLYCDLDRFKQVNDWTSHLAGDAVLQETAQRIRSALGPRDFAARIGGDEFVVVGREVPNAAAAEALAERVRRAVGGREFDFDGHRLHATVSVGVALSGPDTTSYGLLREGDIALHEGKVAGRDQWQMYHPGMSEEVQRKIDVAAEVRACFGRNEIQPWFMPIVSLLDRQVVAVESLACIVRPGQPPTLAARWINEADDEGILALIGPSLVEASVAAMASMPPGRLLSLNVAASELSEADYAGFLLDVLARHRVDPARILVEITEQVANVGTDRVGMSLEQLASHGVRVVLDRFGSDHTSLRHLRDYPIAGLKLDRTLVQGIVAADGVSAAVAASLADLCRRLDIMAIAEGIETADQEVAVAAAGWTFGQGWLFSTRPAGQSMVSGR